MKENNSREEILSLGMWELFRKLAIPSMFGIVIAAFYNLTDAFFVGRFVGKEAVGATTLVFAAVMFNTGLFSMVGAGSSSVLSIALGKKDKITINKLLMNVVLSVVLLCGVFSLLVFLFTSELVEFFGGVGQIHGLAVDYLKILCLGFVFAGLGPAMNYLNRGEGRMKQAMRILIFAGLLNVVLDFVFIYYFRWGIEGAAYATVVSQVVFVFVQVLYFIFGNSVISLSKVRFGFDFGVFSKVLKVGFSHFIMSFMGAVQMVILFKSLEFYGGESHVVLMGVCYRIFMFMFLVVWGLGCGLQPIVGVNFGAGQFSRIRLAFESFRKYIFRVSFSIWVLFMIFPKFFLGLFVNDFLFVEQYYNFLRILFAIFVLYVFQPIIVNLFLGLAKAKEAVVVMFSRQVIFFIPFVLVLPMFFGVLGVWIALPLADFCSLMLAIFLKNRIFKGNLVGEDLVLVEG